MDDEQKAAWLRLCEQAVVEQDSARLLLLVQEINRLLDEKEQRKASRHMGLDRDGAFEVKLPRKVTRPAPSE